MNSEELEQLLAKISPSRTRHVGGALHIGEDNPEYILILHVLALEREVAALRAELNKTKQ